MTTPTCTLTFSNVGTAVEPYSLTVENLDPDAVTVSNYDTAIGLIRTKTTLQFTVAVEPGNTTTTIAPWHDPGSDFYVAAISDNQARGTVEANPVFQSVLRDIGIVNPAFYTDSGDLVQGSDDDSTLADMFQAVLDSANSISVPMYPIAGNHDYSPNLSIYTSYFGQPDYHFTYGSADFVALSTSIDASRGDVTTEQLQWLDTVLSGSSAAHRIVWFHHPLVVPSWGKPSCCFEDVVQRDALASVLDTGRADLVITGHSQGYDNRFLTSGDIPSIQTGFSQLVTGGSGGHISQPHGQHHFTLLHVTPTGVEPSMISTDDFATAVSYSHNNGGSTTPQATVENSGNDDLPYIRLKFKLANQAASYVVTDNTGAHYTTFYTHNQGDYTVLYLEVAAPAHSSITYTVSPIGGISATTQNGTTLITNVATDPILAWTETPSTSTEQTNYTISQLTPYQDVTVVMNEHVFLRTNSGSTGTISFSVQDHSVLRNFIVRITSDYPTTIITVPANHGAPQVRLFDTTGHNLGNWFALNRGIVAPYQVMATNSTVIVRRSDQPSSIAAYDFTGITQPSLTKLNQAFQSTALVAQIGRHLQPTTLIWKNQHLIGYRGKKVFRQKLFLPTTTVSSTLAGHFLPGVTDQVCLTADSMTVVQCYRWQRGKYHLWQTITPWSGSSAPLQFGVAAGKLIVSQLAAPGQVAVYTYNTTTQQFIQSATWYGYGRQFSGGTTFAQ